ncbi:MAG: GNAT family N-acetyltransferase [Acidimicrobiales bacterium]
MSTSSVELVHWRGEKARTGPWRGDPDVAYLSPVIGGPPLSGEFIAHFLDKLASEGFTQVVTGALSPLEQLNFLDLGFRTKERLAVLTHDLHRVLSPATAPGRAGTGPLEPSQHRGTFGFRSGQPADLGPVLVVDHMAFSYFWRFDHASLNEALAATPRHRFRVAASPDRSGEIVGYAITGRAGRAGYLQRLAVAPEFQGRGLGRALILDSLAWIRRWRGAKVMVNTQEQNIGAIRLYEKLGFVAEPFGLAVLSTPFKT